MKFGSLKFEVSPQAVLDWKPPLGYTLGMKTAISLPDEIFGQAEEMAKTLKVSRSELYCRALQEYLARHAPDRVTEALDKLSNEVATRPEPFLRRAGRRVLERDEW
ncbi:MAG: hypothetical protein OEZ06_08765 [Myxococcales bacterium]|nr:hypothetical protein [Myxococcales bacterium]